jgi:hypothetical protein
MKHLASHISSFFSSTPICVLNSSHVSEASVNTILVEIITQKITQECLEDPLKHQIWTSKILSRSAWHLQHIFNLFNVLICLWFRPALILELIFK